MGPKPSVLDAGTGWSHRRYRGKRGTDLDFVVHEYATAIAQGHCIPGGTDHQGSGTLAPLNRTTCDGDTDLHWGKTVLAFFLEHPAPR
jgi:hypothetical protein